MNLPNAIGIIEISTPPNPISGVAALMGDRDHSER